MSAVETVAAAPTLVLPHLFHPFRTPVHPDADRAEADLQAWMNGHGLLEDPRWASGIRHGKIGEYCARVYAYSTFDGLCSATRAYGWIFSIDDGLCSLHGVARSPGDLGALYLWLYEMIADPAGHDPVPLRDALAARLPHMAAFLPALQRATQDICTRHRGRVHGRAIRTLDGRHDDVPVFDAVGGRPLRDGCRAGRGRIPFRPHVQRMRRRRVCTDRHRGGVTKRPSHSMRTKRSGACASCPA